MAQTLPTTQPGLAVPPALVGRPVEEVRILGQTHAVDSTLQAEIRHQIQTREGEKFDPQTVQADYQRIYGLKRFSNVEARVEPTANGVIVVFVVGEQSQIKSIVFRGNSAIDNETLNSAVSIKTGEAIDAFRIASARETIERLYRTKNFTFAHVDVPEEPLAKNGELIFNIVQGPNVTIRKVEVLGNHAFSDDKLKDVIKTTSWFPIFRPGTLDMDTLEQDVSAIRQHYEQHGYFDTRVGRKLSFSADQSEVMVSFVVDEGRRYSIDHIQFKGNSEIPEVKLRKALRLAPESFTIKRPWTATCAAS